MNLKNIIMKKSIKKAEFVKGSLSNVKKQCVNAKYFLKVDGGYMAFNLKSNYEAAKFIIEMDSKNNKIKSTNCLSNACIYSALTKK